LRSACENEEFGFQSFHNWEVHMRWLACILCFGVAILGSVADGGDKTAPKIEGTWQVTSITFPDGKKVSGDKLAEAKGTYVFKNGKFKATIDGKEVSSGTFKVDATQKPAAIDLTYGDKTHLGIFMIDGDTLTLAEGNAGKQRPKAFESGPDLLLTVLKRAK
jgi:uncharacterized protein (TIGR03067 family)